MNGPLEQNYYELLEIPRDATLAEIDRAYERARAYYGAGSVAVYALATPDELKRVQERIDEAFLVLSDESARREYDGRLGPPGPDERPLRKEVLRAQEEKEAPRAPEPPPVAEPAPEPPKPAAVAEPPPPQPAAVAEPPPAPTPPVAEAAAKPPEPKPEPPVEVKVESPPPEPAAVEPPKVEVAAAAEPSKPVPAVEPAPAEPAKAAEPAKPVEKPPESPKPTVGEGPLPPPTMAYPEPAPRATVAKRDTKPGEPAIRAGKPDIPADAVFSGELLRQLRESQGLSLQEIADRTKIGRPHLENIEADRFAALPAQVYLRGFLMSLARELRLDPLRVSKSYLEQMGDAKGRQAAKPRS